MLDAAALAVATGAAGNVLAYLLQGQTDTLRTRISAIFQRGTAREESIALRALEEHAEALEQRRVTQAEVTAQWSSLLAAFLTAYPEARADIEALRSSVPSGMKTVHIGSQHNHGRGTFIGGDNHGTVRVDGQEER
ncbi:hypothetical protein AQI88_09810 [Streptomyces cellostaticus]|uniref:Uncharacterized protein n=1 Tax=Streptomyces cellostaticus TaxID=67285 RepID=A0A117PXD5_9ACTN|nr:hypothetical protein [Streptomyces cellostaticus]KUM96785.1 hypothetical protein AQI88_09810 [Streptomyces cellostaticus]GHI05801.1 hypothetical protein Scel_41220 [Streptomyces cellostaticus]